MKKVAVIMGSDSDWPVVKGACTQLDALNIPYEAHILSAHRTPVQAAEFAKSARERGFGVVICAAGIVLGLVKLRCPFCHHFLGILSDGYSFCPWCGDRLTGSVGV